MPRVQPLDTILDDASDAMTELKYALETLIELEKDLMDHVDNATRRLAKIDKFTLKQGSNAQFADNEDEYYNRIRRNYRNATSLQDERLAIAKNVLYKITVQSALLNKQTAPDTHN